MHQEIRRYQQRLDNLFGKVATLSTDLELQAHWARYLCVLVSGYIEVSVRLIYSEHAKKVAAPHVARYVDRQLGNFQNPSMTKIIELAGAFSPKWEEELRKNTEGQLKASVDSIVANRNAIAHGQNVGITYATIKKYYSDAVKVIELIDKQCGGK